MGTVKEIKIFIASPDEVNEEREKIEEIINELNDTISKSYSIHLKIITWEKNVAPQMGRPQEVVNEQIKPDESDIFIGILWTKFGSKTGIKSSIESNQLNSGTEEEFEIAYNSLKNKGFPYIMFYRSNRQKRIDLIDPSQLQKVNSFFRRFKHDGKTPGIYSIYANIEDFSSKIRHDLLVSIDKIFPSKDDDDNPTLSNFYQNSGFNKLFLPQNNSARTINKNQVLSQAKYINLIAETGHAYLASIAHRYRDVIENLLKNNCEVKIILSNPFSVSGLLRTFSECQVNCNDVEEVLNTKNIDDAINYLSKLYDKSNWYRIKLLNSIEGYNIIKDKYGDLIKLKFTKLDIPASIAITDNNAFFEPYLNINIRERTQKDMMTFDIQITNKSYLYQHFKNYFKYFWDISSELDLYKIDQKDEIQRLINFLRIQNTITNE